MSSNEPKSEKEKSGKESVKKMPEKRVPAHGVGALYTGGVPGNKGGTGRPPNNLRERFRKVLDEGRGIDLVAATVQAGLNPESNGWEKSTALKAVDLAAKYGLGEAPAIQEGLSEFIASLSVEYVPEDQREAFVKAVFDGMAQFVG